MKNNIRSLLYRSFDEPLEQSAAADLQTALRSSASLQNEYDQINALRRQFLQCNGWELKPFFSARVINRLAAEREPQQLFFAALFSTFRHLAIAVSVCLVLVYAAIFLSGPGSPVSVSGSRSADACLDELYSSAFLPSLEDLL
jgi:hypothetical protein